MTKSQDKKPDEGTGMYYFPACANSAHGDILTDGLKLTPVGLLCPDCYEVVRVFLLQPSETDGAPVAVREGSNVVADPVDTLRKLIGGAG